MMRNRALLSLLSFLVPLILVLVVSFLISGGPAFADLATFTPPPTLTPLPSSTPGSPTPSPVSTPVPTYVVGIFRHWWETGTIGDDCGLSFSTYPSSLFSLTIPSDGIAAFVSGGLDLCVPDRRELVDDVTSRWQISSSTDISVVSSVWVTVSAQGDPSSVEFLVEGSCGSGDCRYYMDYLGSGIYHFVFNVEAANRDWDHSMVIRCRGWYWNQPGHISCLFRQDVTVCGPDGCGSLIQPPEPPPSQECCTGPGECELRPGQFLRIRGAAPVSPVYDVQLWQLGVIITGDLPGSYIVLGASPRTDMLLISSQPLTYLLGSSSCTFPACGGSSFCSVFSPGGIVSINADCVGPDPVLSVIGVPVSGITSWMCPITAFCSRDFPPYDLGQGALPVAGECAHPGFPDGYWVPVSGTVAAASNAFDIDEYWLFIDYSGLVPSLPVSSPIEYRDGNETCFDIPPFGDALNEVLTRLFSRSIDVFTVCIFPRYFKLRGFPGSDTVFDGLISLFVFASAFLIIRSLHRLGRA